MAWDWSGAGSGAIGGAGAGSAFGPWGTAIGGGIGALTGGIFGGKKTSQESPMQKKQRQLVDQLLASLNGNGPYSSLFQANEADFNKSYREPAMANFRNRTAPMIRGEYTGGTYGQQREGTGLQDSLTRAGVDLDQMLNSAWVDYQNQAKDRQYNAMNQILNQQGAPYSPTYSEQFAQSGGIDSGLTAIGEGYRQRGLEDERIADRAQRKDLMDQQMQFYKRQREGFDAPQGAF